MRTYLYSYELHEDYDSIPDRMVFYRWLFFLMIGDFIFPFLFDPFLVFGPNFLYDILIDYEDVYVILVLFFLPVTFLYYYDTMGAYSFLIAFFFYVFFVNWAVYMLYTAFILDFVYFFVFIMIVTDYLVLDGEEEIGDEDFI